MANVLSVDKQATIIGLLAEGSSIRSIERVTGVHRDTIMRLGVRVGKGCQKLMDAKLRDLPCQHLQFDEIWARQYGKASWKFLRCVGIPRPLEPMRGSTLRTTRQSPSTTLQCSTFTR